MAEFIGLYRGRTISEAELIALCAEPRIVRMFTDELLGESPRETEDRGRKLVPIHDRSDDDED